MMIWVIECVISCLIFGVIIVGSTLKNQTLWLSEYPIPVQERYIELHPDSDMKEPEGYSKRVIVKKSIVSIMLLALLAGMTFLAGARTFVQGMLYSYGLWFVVNAFDTIVIDMGIMPHWKKCRLPGTEDMDEEYRLLIPKSLKAGVHGCLIGIPIALISGLVIFGICR